MFKNISFKLHLQFIYLVIFLGTIESSIAWRATLDRAEIPIQNHDMVDFNFTIFKLNRTSFAANTSINIFKDIPDNVMLQIKLYGTYSNEYRELPFLVKRSLCEIFVFEYKLIINEVKGTFPSECPVKKGHYYFDNFIPNTRYFPNNPWKITKYKFEFLFMEKNKIHAQLNIFFHSTNIDEYFKE